MFQDCAMDLPTWPLSVNSHNVIIILKGLAVLEHIFVGLIVIYVLSIH